MTREEAIARIKEHKNIHKMNEPRAILISEALDIAIEALEQEPILDKIRTEIEQVKSIMNEEIINNNRKDLINFVNGLNQSLVIIDKYRESEG